MRTEEDGEDALEDELHRRLRAGARVLLLQTSEERRALGLLEEVADRLALELRTWSAAAGIDDEGAAGRGSLSPRALLDELRRDRGVRELWVLLDAGPALLELATSRALREFALASGPARVVVSGVSLPHELRDRIPEAASVTLPLPELAALRARLADVAGRLERAGHRHAQTSLEGHIDALAQAALGLTLAQLEQLVAEAVLARGEVEGPAVLAWIRRRKPALALGAAGLLERVRPTPAEHLGGLTTYKRWLARRRLALDPRARAAGIPTPRGVLLLGVQGCGKSLAARASASLLELPLIRLDPGRLFGGTVGESEANLRAALRAAERMAPVVLWVDEIDKSLAGVEGTASDAGTTARVIGGLLTWLQERAAPVFVVMTANRVDALPPELMRRGRLDELFFVDLPGPAERAAILEVHLSRLPAARLGRAPQLADSPEAFAALARAAEGFSGAELEAALIEARLAAFAETRPLAADDLAGALQTIIPLSRSRARELSTLRAWAETRARRA